MILEYIETTMIMVLANQIIEGLHENYEEGCGPFDTPQYIEELSRIHSYVDRLIAIFLPKFSIKPEH